MRPKFRGTIDRSKSRAWPIIYDEDLESFCIFMDSFKEGTHVFVTIEKIEKRKQRSLEQNAYYWGVVLHILETDGPGYTKDEWHEALKQKFLSYENVPGVPTTLSTTGLSTVEMEVYLENIRRWASEFLGVVIPEPNQIDFT